MWKTDDSIILRDIGGEAILIPTGSRVIDLNGMITLNATAQFIWPLLDGGHSLEQIAQAVATEFDTTRESALADVSSFVQDIDRMRLIVDAAAAGQEQA